jgi:predicted ATPase/DNA-binding SARP family transcriptional activator/Tfp pilus assembly protein PilF
MSVRLHLFGSPTIEYGGESLALPFERRSQLLAFLALKRSWVGRAELAAMLWPEQANKLAYANLRKTLFRLQSFPWGAQVELLGGALRFEVDTDVSAFEIALREGRSADALALRRGELLAGFDDDSNEAWSSWLSFERDRLRVAWRKAALEHLAADIEPGDGIALSRELLKADPLDEAALRLAMTWLARAGQASLAREVYRDFAARLSEELGLTPGAELKALHDSIGVTAATAAAAKLAVSTLEDDLVGRAVELRRIATLLSQDDCRLVCVTGPGGVGKTRLVRRAVEELAGSFLHGAAFVPLEDIASIGGFGGQLARELAVSLRGGREPLEQVIAYLRERQMLLALDNFEHLAAAASILERLLSDCTRLKLLVTSRVRLALAAEWLLPLGGLPCPEPEDQDRIEAFDAARLFIQAARRVEPAFVPSVEAAAIVDICRQVEGLPLALELAAAWTRVLSCDAIAAELRQSIELLHATDSAHPARHASMDMVFDQSWQLLSAVERSALARLSVFRGGFSAEAARAVAGASLPVLGALADKSLLRKDGARTSMHPLVQQLAARRLGEGDTRESAERAHAGYFHHWMAQSRRATEGGEREALQWMDTEFENCRLAWHWSAAHGGNGELAKGALTLLYFCDHRGRFEDGLSLLRETLESRRVSDDRSLETLLLSIAAHFEFRLDRYADAESTATRALAASRGRENHDAKLQCLKVLGSCCVRLGRHADAKRYFQQALQVAPESTHPHNAAAMYANLAVIEKSSGHYDDALRLLLQSLVLHRRLGDLAGAAGTLSTLGGLYADKREYETAGVYLREGLAICDRHGLVSTRGVILANLTEVALKTNDLDLAESCARRALEIAQAAGNRGLACWTKLQLVRLALQRGDLSAARSQLAASMAIALAVVQPVLQLAGTICLAQILHAQGEPECARSVLNFAADHPSSDAPERDEARVQLAQWHSGASTQSAWPGMELSELTRRIVVESNVAYAPLIATLRSAHSPPPQRGFSARAAH